MPGGKHIDGVDATHIVKVDFEGVLASAAAKTGIIDKNVDFALFCHRGVNKSLKVGFVEHVALNSDGFPAHFDNLVDYCLSLLFVDVADNDRGEAP